MLKYITNSSNIHAPFNNNNNDNNEVMFYAIYSSEISFLCFVLLGSVLIFFLSNLYSTKVVCQTKKTMRLRA